MKLQDIEENLIPLTASLPSPIKEELHISSYCNTSLLSVIAYSTVTLKHNTELTFPGIQSKKLPCYIMITTQKGSGRISYVADTNASNKRLYTADITNKVIFHCNTQLELSLSAHSVWEFTFYLISGPSIETYQSCLDDFQNLYTIQEASCVGSYFSKLHAYLPTENKADSIAASKWLTDIYTEMCLMTMHFTEHKVEVPGYLQEIKLLFDEAYQQHYSLSSLEEEFSISKYRLCREFTQYYQISPLQYLNNRRLEAAKELLLTTDLAVHEIGSAVGIENTNHFINLFKKLTGATPFVFKQGASAPIRALHSPYRADDLL